MSGDAVNAAGGLRATDGQPRRIRDARWFEQRNTICRQTDLNLAAKQREQQTNSLGTRIKLYNSAFQVAEAAGEDPNPRALLQNKSSGRPICLSYFLAQAIDNMVRNWRRLSAKGHEAGYAIRAQHVPHLIGIREPSKKVSGKKRLNGIEHDPMLSVVRRTYPRSEDLDAYAIPQVSSRYMLSFGLRTKAKPSCRT
jgi:hypothetical protein